MGRTERRETPARRRLFPTLRASWTPPNGQRQTFPRRRLAHRRAAGNRALLRNPANKRGDLVFLFCRRRRFRLSLRTVAPADDLLRVLKRHPVSRRLARHQGTSRRLPNLPAVPNIGDFETARHATSAGFGRWLLSQQNHRADGAPYRKAGFPPACLLPCRDPCASHDPIEESLARVSRLGRW